MRKNAEQTMTQKSLMDPGVVRVQATGTAQASASLQRQQRCLP